MAVRRALAGHLFGIQPNDPTTFVFWSPSSLQRSRSSGNTTKVHSRRNGRNRAIRWFSAIVSLP
jgi:hypothetical protein